LTLSGRGRLHASLLGSDDGGGLSDAAQLESAPVRSTRARVGGSVRQQSAERRTALASGKRAGMPGLWSAILDVARRRERAPALCWEGRVYTYGEILSAAESAARWFRERGVRTGDRVAVAWFNSPKLVVALLGVLRAGAVYVPVSPHFTAREVAYLLDHSGARVALVHERLRRELQQSMPELAPRLAESIEPASAPGVADAAVAEEEPALLVYTSGTTGQPKGAVLSHRALLANLKTVASAWRWTERECLLLCLPCSHLHGLALGLLASFLAGSAVVLQPRFVPETVERDIRAWGATMFFGVPTMYNRLVQLPASAFRAREVRKVRLWACGSAPLTAATFERFQVVARATILERYGMTEGGFMISAPYDGPRRPGVVGYPLPGIEVRLVDPDAADAGALRDVPRGEEGEIAVRGPNLFSGYWRDRAATDRAFLGGYFRTGDLAATEADGMIRIVGRRAVDIIKTRGYKVSAIEIENCLQRCRGVREVAVVGVPHPDLGEEVVAVVAAESGRGDEEELLATARASLAPFKVPTRIVFLPEIPKAGPGKFCKVELRRQLVSTAP